MDAACQLHPEAAPSNPGMFGVGRSDRPEAPSAAHIQQRSVAGFQQELTRDLFRGRGFYRTLQRQAIKDRDCAEVLQALTLGDKPSPVHAPLDLKPLPVENFLDIKDQGFVDALLMEALPADRARLRQYMSERHLGLGLVTAVSYLDSSSFAHC